MTATGRLHLGDDYIAKTERLRELMGMRKGSDAVRALIDEVLEDAEEMKVNEIPRRAIGIKPFARRRRPKGDAKN